MDWARSSVYLTALTAHRGSHDSAEDLTKAGNYSPGLSALLITVKVIRLVVIKLMVKG